MHYLIRAICYVRLAKLLKASVYTIMVLLTLKIYNTFKAKNEVLSSSDSLYNITDFKYTIQQPPCGHDGSLLNLLIIVHTNPHHFHRREIIRETWANQMQNSKYGNFRVLFLMGLVSDDHVQEKIRYENNINNDIIQGSFTDHYRNLTYKHVMGLKWVTSFCSKMKMVLKVDDDVFINTPAILKSLKTDYWNTKIVPKTDDFIYCDVWFASEVVRNENSKWFVSKEDYASDVYPDYCAGYAIFYGGQAPQKLFNEAQKLSYVSVDDAFVTGIVREKTDVTIVHGDDIKNRDTDNISQNPERYKEFLIGSHNIGEETMKDLWQSLRKFLNDSRS